MAMARLGEKSSVDHIKRLGYHLNLVDVIDPRCPIKNMLSNLDSHRIIIVGIIEQIMHSLSRVPLLVQALLSVKPSLFP
jgi:hypothetical protein